MIWKWETLEGENKCPDEPFQDLFQRHIDLGHMPPVERSNMWQCGQNEAVTNGDDDNHNYDHLNDLNLMH